MSWVWIAVISYFFGACANTVDKVIVSRYISRPSVYGFYVGAVQALAIFLLLWGIQLLPWHLLAAALSSGALFILGLVLMYAALAEGETSRVVPLIGGTLPLATLGLSSVLLGEALTKNQFAAFGMLVIGIIFMTYSGEQGRIRSYRFAAYAVSAGAIFALSYTASKYVYTGTDWVTGFFWMRMGSVAAAAVLYAAPHQREAIRCDFEQPKKTKVPLVLGNQTLGAIGFVLLNYAISLGSVTIINALQAVQYVFVFILTLVAGRRVEALREHYDAISMAQKLVAIGFISFGLYFLTT